MASKGKFVWYDLSTTDLGGALAFYGEVVGYKAQKFEASPGFQMPEYTMLMANEVAIGGVMPQSDGERQMGAPPHWIAYIATPDTDATTRRAIELGGKCFAGPMDIPDVGRFAVLQDPFGAVFAAFTSSSSESGPEAEGQGRVSWNELNTSDIDGAYEFYRDLFGWEITNSLQGDDFRYEIFGLNSVDQGGIGPIPPGVPMSFWMIYITVDDIDAAVARVTQNGGKVLNGPMTVPGGSQVAQCMDPQGAAFGITTPAN